MSILLHNKDILVTISTTFSATMLGFLTAVITILFSFTNTAVFLNYERKGNIPALFGLYAITILFLIITFILSIFAMLLSKNIFCMQLIIVFMLTDIILIGFISLITTILAGRSLRERIKQKKASDKTKDRMKELTNKTI